LNSNQHRRILVYRIGQIGDTVVALPALWAIRQYFPEAHLALLNDQHAGSNYLPALRILPEHGLFNEFIGYKANQEGAPFWKTLRLIPHIRRRRFDTLVYLAPRFRTRRQIWRDLAFFRLCGLTRFIGHKGMTTFEELTRKKPLPRLDHEADHLLSRLGRSGIPVPPPGQGCMDLRLTAGEMEKARHWLTGHIEMNAKQILIGMGVGSKHPANVWPRERFAEAGRHIIEHLGGTLILFGGPEDREFGDSLINEWRAGVNTAGELTVRQAAAALSFCRLYVGNNSGPMHLAAAVGTHCIGIFSGRDFPGCWHPYGAGHLVLSGTVDCEGCMLSDCEEYGMACIKQISVEDVILACNNSLNNKKIVKVRV
jgi:lipopolysaccharide heptosyltransferase III